MNMEKQYIKNEVKIQLWRLGKRVRDMEIFPGVNYDLLVAGKIRVGITQGNKDCDIIADMIDGKIRYAKNHWHMPKKELQWEKPTAIFGPKG